MSDLNKTLQERRSQHGDFSDNASISQAFKEIARHHLGSGYTKMSHVQRESIDMILHKISRILAGDPDHHDHWDDIAGYATITSQRIPKAKAGI